MIHDLLFYLIFCSIRSIKEATQTYINMEALPQMIQGVTICDGASTREWRPFCIDPLKHTRKEVQDIIWHDTQIGSIHKETWDKVILSEIPKFKAVETDTKVNEENVREIN